MNSIFKSILYSDSLAQGFFNLHFMAKDVDIVQRQGKMLFILYDFFPYISNLDWLLLEERKYPLVFFYPRKIAKNISIKYPEDEFKISNEPKNCRIYERKIISYSQIVNTKPGSVSISNDLSIIDKFVKVKNYKKLRYVFESIQQKSKEQLIGERKK